MAAQPQEHWRRLLLRSEATAAAYKKAQQQPKQSSCRLCSDQETISTHNYWRLMPNKFPYDRYFSRSDMLVTKRHVDERGLNDAERAELLELKSTVLSTAYDLVLENLPKQSSIPHHYHVHLVTIKRPREAA